MPKYWYNSKNLAGSELSGEYDALNEKQVVDMLRQSGYFPIEVKLVVEKKRLLNQKKVNLKSLAVFCTQMSTVLKAGVAVPEAFEILTSQTEDRYLSTILRDVYNKVQGGKSFTDALVPYRGALPVMFISMVEAGEASGTLDVCLGRAGDAFQRQATLNSKLRNSMIYPTILIIMTVAIVSMLMIVVVPLFVDLFSQSGTALPLLTRMLVAISNFFVKYWIVMLALVIGFAIGFRLWISTDNGRLAFDKFKLTAPIIGKVSRKVGAARYSRTLSSMAAAGIPLTEALSITARTLDNKYLETQLYSVVDSVKSGVDLSSAISKLDIFPPLILHMTKLGEKSGELENLLSQAANFYEQESDVALQSLTALMEPLIIVVMAIFVVPVILGVMMPVFQSYTIL